LSRSPSDLRQGDPLHFAIKITGACTLSHEPFPHLDIWDPLGRIVDAFGLDRCMCGTDWTRAVKLLTYAKWLMHSASPGCPMVTVPS
jgi:predicted TIM-barrel fold metal-dependent hydrolase